MIKRKLLKESGVKAFSYSCGECGESNVVYLADAYSEVQTSGALCNKCSEVVWCNGRENPTLKFLMQPPVDSGKQYQDWRKKVTGDFLDSFSECGNCQSGNGYEFASNKPLAMYHCGKCRTINKKPALKDVTSDHLDDLVLWEDFQG